MRVISTLLSFCMTGLALANPLLPEGFEFVNLTQDDAEEEWFRMNNCGQIVFSKQTDGTFESYEIFVYDNESTLQLTDNLVADRLPQINDSNTVVWQEHELVNETGDYKLMMYKDGMSLQFDTGLSPRINSSDHVAWKRFNNEGCESSDANIYLHDGLTVQQLTEDAQSSQIGRINNNNEIVWTQYDFCPAFWEAEIMHWADGVITQITVDEFQPQLPVINDIGVIAWQTQDLFAEKRIMVHEDGATTELTDFGSSPKINNQGDIAFTRSLPDSGSAWLYQKATDTFYQLADDPNHNGSQDINDWGEVAIYLNFGWPHTDVGLLRRIRTGDSEFDGDVDCDDWSIVKDNWTEPGDPPVYDVCDCEVPPCDTSCEGDANGDGTVDPLDSGFVLARFGDCP